jgi:isoamylase
MIALRMNRALPNERLEMTLAELLREQPVKWHGVKLNTPDLADDSHTVAATVRLLGYRLLLHLIINAYWEPLDFELPTVDDAQGPWRRCIDTYLDPPDDVCDLADAPQLGGSTYHAQPRSVVLLLANSD